MKESLFIQALTHKSAARPGCGGLSNERLEFLGDAIIQQVVTLELYHRHPDTSEGELTKMRSAIVNGRVLAAAARKLDLPSRLLLSIHEDETGGREKTSILGDAFEAWVGATFLSGPEGPARARTLVLQACGHMLTIPPKDDNFKGQLLEVAQAEGFTPQYQTTRDPYSPEDKPRFSAMVVMANLTEWGGGGTVKSAEQAAAKAALKRMGKL